MPIEKTTPTTLKNAGGTYVVIPSSTIEAIQSPQALAILIYLLDRPPNWIIRRDHIRRRFKIGKEGYAKALKELAAIGLAWREHERNEEGQITGTQLCVSAAPRTTPNATKPTRTTESPENRTVGEIASTESPDCRTVGKTGHLHRTELTNTHDKVGPAEEKAGPRRLKNEWYPSEKTLQQAIDIGYQFDDIDHIINEFRIYWIGQEKRRKEAGWNKTFLNRLHALHNQQQGKGSYGKRSGSQVIADDLTAMLRQQGAL